MSEYWPRGIDFSDTQSPTEILETAQEEWTSMSEGVLTLVLQKTTSENGYDMIIVHAKHVPSRRTTTLFSVVHRPSTPYPVTLQPKEADLPKFLKKSYFSPGLAFPNLELKSGTYTNEWVSDTPSEFRVNLEGMFNLGTVKSEILSLLSHSTARAIDENEDPSEESSNEG